MYKNSLRSSNLQQTPSILHEVISRDAYAFVYFYGSFYVMHEMSFDTELGANTYYYRASLIYSLPQSWIKGRHGYTRTLYGTANLIFHHKFLNLLPPPPPPPPPPHCCAWSGFRIFHWGGGGTCHTWAEGWV